MFNQKLNLMAPVVLRLTMAAVFVWFGTSQLANSLAWVSMVPDWASSLTGMSAETIVRLNGTFEVIAASLLAIGIWVRPVALLLALHLFGITTTLGLSPTGVRDFGLSFATLTVALYGSDTWSIVSKKEVI